MFNNVEHVPNHFKSVQRSAQEVKFNLQLDGRLS